MNEYIRICKNRFIKLKKQYIVAVFGMGIFTFKTEKGRSEFIQKLKMIIRGVQFMITEDTEKWKPKKRGIKVMRIKK
jgi:hypothetical protein